MSHVTGGLLCAPCTDAYSGQYQKSHGHGCADPARAWCACPGNHGGRFGYTDWRDGSRITSAGEVV